MQRVKDEKGRRRSGHHSHGVESCFGDKTECALAAHHEVGQNLRRRIKIDERIQRISHRVLDGELPLNFGLQAVGVQDALTQLQQSRTQVRLCVTKTLLGVGEARVDDGAAGQHDDG